MNDTNKRLRLIYSLIAFAFPFIVYVMTLAPSVTFIDAGELATVATKLGVAHPTGYPLFTIIGNVFTRIPVGDEIYRLNMMSAFLSSLAAMFFFYLLLNLMKTLLKNSGISSIPEAVLLNISLAGTLVLAFSRTFWETANSIEVYSLHTLFLVLNIYIILIASGEIRMNNGIPTDRYWLLFGYVLGLSFTNHLSGIFLSVACLYLYFSSNGFGIVSFRRIAIMAIAFIAGFSVYAYLFIRAGNDVISWGNPYNFENFWRHFTGKQFSVWMFTSFENAEKQFSYFTGSYPMEFVIIPLMLAIPGVVFLFRLSKRTAYFTLLLFLFCVLYAINYDIYDIDSYFLLAFITSAIWITAGICWIWLKLKNVTPSLSYALLLIPFLPLVVNYEKADESKNNFVDDYTMNVFASADSNAIILSTQWDFWISSSMYQQFVRNIRPDIAVIDKELLRRTWYFEYLRDHYPEIYSRSEAEINAYLIELRKFELNSERYTNPRTEADRQDLVKIQSSFLALLNSVVDKNIEDRSVYLTYEIDRDNPERFGNNYTRIPQGLLIKFSSDRVYDNYQMPEFKFEVTERSDYHYGFLMNSYYSAYLNRANYLMNHNKFDDAEQMINKALDMKPGAPEAIQLLNKNKQLKDMSTQQVN